MSFKTGASLKSNRLLPWYNTGEGYGLAICEMEWWRQQSSALKVKASSLKE